MIHEANHVRPARDGLKVGGHQASSASIVSILTTLYFSWLRAGDLVSIKPHASPAYHAIQYLLGNLDVSMLPRLREFGGLQSYPSRTKDPDPVDFSTGSVGLGAAAPMFAALADRYLRLHLFEAVASHPERRFVATVGDAELDEGNIWEAVLEDALSGLGNITMIVDLNRQSLDRVVPGIRVRRIEGMFAAAGWHVLEAKYGHRLSRRFAMEGGDILRQRIDEMANEDYQILIRLPGAEARARLLDDARAVDRDALRWLIADVPDDGFSDLLSDLGGHDHVALLQVLRAAEAERNRPTIIFAYTIKGWKLPFAGDRLNHSALLSADQVDRLAGSLGADSGNPWAGFDDGSMEEQLCKDRRQALGYRAGRAVIEPSEPQAVPEPDIRATGQMSTQQAFGDAIASLARDVAVGRRIVTAAPDVAVSTSLGGWINRAGVFSSTVGPARQEGSGPLVWAPNPSGRHVELGISEMNLFLWLSQFGLAGELFGERLVPIGSVYDPFIARGLDALTYALYVDSHFILVGTPSGISLAPEGGAHQSTYTPSLGIEMPGLRFYEPVFAREVAWTLQEGIRGCLAATDGFATYLRLTTRPIDQGLAGSVERRLGADGWRDATLAGGYRLIDYRDADVSLPEGSPIVQIVASGAIVPEAIRAVSALHAEEVAANLIVVTSPERLSGGMHDGRLRALRTGRADDIGYAAHLIPAEERHAPIVTVADASSHALSFLGGAFGAPVVPLGVDAFGQSGALGELYAHAGIDADHVVEAAILALELAT
jgi:pyruvate dehydrogenase E1 component